MLREVLEIQQGAKQRTLPLSFQCSLDSYRGCPDALGPTGLVNALENSLQSTPGSGKPLTPIPHDHIRRKHQKMLEQPCSSMKQQTPGVRGAPQLCTGPSGDCLAIAEQEEGWETDSVSLNHSRDLSRLKVRCGALEGLSRGCTWGIEGKSVQEVYWQRLRQGVWHLNTTLSPTNSILKDGMVELQHKTSLFFKVSLWVLYWEQNCSHPCLRTLGWTHLETPLS